MFDGDCRKCIVVYEAKCKICKDCYVGCTQQTLKDRTTQHLSDVVKMVNKDFTSDSFAAHFAKHFQSTTNDATVGSVRKMVDVKILWQGDPIKCVKSFGKKSCRLCMQERIEILKRSKKDPGRLINAKNEMYGACRHKPRFHRFKSSKDKKASTDDGSNLERVETHSRDRNAKVRDPPPGILNACRPVAGVDAARADI